MADTPLDLYGAYQRAVDQYNREYDRYMNDVNTWNDLYYSGQYDAMRSMGEPVEPNAPAQTAPQEQGQQLRSTSPYELYSTTFGRGTPDVLTNEAWSLANISTPFLSGTPETAYDKGQVAKVNNPLSYVGPEEMYTGQTDETNLNTMQGQNIFY